MDPIPKKIVMWALTYKCNAKCKYCYLRDYDQPHDDLSETQIIEVSKKIATNPQWKPDAIWLTGGEPSLLKILPYLVDTFESLGISTVINTNGIMSKDTLDKILIKSPSGVIVSLDEYSDVMQNDRFILPSTVIEKLSYILSNKSEKTLLGTAIVISKSNISRLFDYAYTMREHGVQYVSLNPLFQEGDHDVSYANELVSQVERIKKEIDIQLPSDFYLDFLFHHLAGTQGHEYNCPALSNYYFISPWGYIYPCSNEIWQKNQGFTFDLLNSDNWYTELQQEIIDQKFNYRTNHSECFSNRCAGCWKLYYDTIFTGELKYEK